MSHSLCVFSGLLHSASVANDTVIPDSFVFTAVAFPIFYRAEDFFAEQTVFIRLKCSVIDGFRF
jgi:hypothetical protein